METGIGAYDSTVDLDTVSIKGAINTAFNIYDTGTTTISNSVFDGGFSDGIDIYGSDYLPYPQVHITNSRILNFFQYGIVSVRSNTDIVSSMIHDSGLVGVDFYKGSLRVASSSFERNGDVGLWNEIPETVTVDAKNNWWGDVSGPQDLLGNPDGLGDTVTEGVDYMPWLLVDPTLPKVVLSGPSNVVFIPGLEASRLYTQGTFFENQLWEPNRNDDVKKLYLDTGGNSINSGIYTRDIVDEINSLPVGQANIYKGFIASMDKMVTDGIINEWKPLPYDWRFDVNDIVNNGVHLGDTLSYEVSDMETEIENLAKTSKSGKVTIVTHSNGGLVAKALLSKMVADGKGALVDQLIMVAAPQLGTPKSVATMLHGDDDIDSLKGMIFSKENSRGLGENMMGAYNLLPSKEYFNRVTDPVIELDPSLDSVVGFSTLNGLYGNSINTFSAFVDFLEGKRDSRVEPEDSDLDTPNVLKTPLLDRTVATHDGIDNWVPPASLKVVQIAGWGLDTLRGILYTTRQECTGPLTPCEMTSVLDRRPLMTKDGDKSVVIPSATEMPVDTFYVDLQKYDKTILPLVPKQDHSDILEISNLQNLVSTLIQGSSTSTLPTFITMTKPIDTEKGLHVSVHSPVSIDVYDSLGAHTGLVPNPNLNSDLDIAQEQIPNSSYLSFGEGKYVFLNQSDSPYIVKLKGTGIGTFTLETSNTLAGKETDMLSYTDIPVSPLTTATMTIQTATTNNTLSVDVDGDGISDLIVTANQELTPLQFFEMFKKVVSVMNLDTRVKVKLIKFIENTEKLINKKNADKILRVKMKTLARFLNTWQQKENISSDDVTVLMQLIDQLKF